MVNKTRKICLVLVAVGVANRVVFADESKPTGLHLTASAVAPTDWPSYRRDAALSGFSPLVGGLATAPSKLWSLNLGGALTNTEQVRLVDLNGDGRDELLRTLPDRLICQNISGEKLWETEQLHRPQVTHVRDFAGDGTRGLLLDTNTGVEHRRYLVDGATGHAVQLYATRNVFGRYERFGKILDDLPGEQLCAWWSGDPVTRFGGDSMRGAGYLWSFENGLDKPKLRFHKDEIGTIYAPLHLFADMDLDGRLDMVMISHEQVWVYDLATGEKTMQSQWGPQIRTYWASTAAMPLKPGEPPALLMINPMIPGVQVVTRQGERMVSRWKQVVGDLEDQYQPTVKIDRAAPDPFVDLDGDGAIEILAAVTNEHGDGLTYLVIFSADDGRRIYDQPGQTVLAVDDLDGDGTLEVLVKQGANTLRICNFNGETFVDRWQAADVEPLIEATPPEGHLGRAVGARSTSLNMPLQRDPEHSQLFLLRFAEDVQACRLQGKTLHRVRKFDSTPRPVPKKPYAWDGRTLSIQNSGQQRATYTLPQRQSYSSPPPLVGTFGNQRRILVREHTGAMVSLAPDGSDRMVIVENTPLVNGASLIDLDGDGKTELLAEAINEEGNIKIIAIDHSGHRQLEIAPPEGATEVRLGPTGSLGADQGRWFVVRHRIPFQNDQVVAYSGKTGKQLWTRDFLGPEYSAATKFALHIPAAVYDVDSDGADDLIASSENWYEIIRPSDNRTVTPNMVITAAVPGHWGAYATPIVADLLGQGRPLVFHNNAYALTLLTELDGSPVWHYGLTQDTGHASLSGLADLDGDGVTEIVTTQKDGLLRAFDAHPLAEKCPTCPADEQLGKANHGGHVRWTFQLPPPLSDLTSLDLDDDRRTEILCGAGDGKLYALEESSGACRILWSVDLGSTVGSPVIVDLNGDQLPEVLVTTSDGQLHCLSGAGE